MLQLELLCMSMNYQVSGFCPLPLLFLKTARIDLNSCKILHGWKWTGWNSTFCHVLSLQGFLLGWAEEKLLAGQCWWQPSALELADSFGLLCFMVLSQACHLHQALENCEGQRLKKAAYRALQWGIVFRLFGEHHHLFGLYHVFNVRLGDFISGLSIKVWIVSV